MPDFKLEDPGDTINPIYMRRKKPKKGLALKLIDWGIVQNMQQANMALLVFIVIAFILIIIINIRTFSSPTTIPVDDLFWEEEVEMM